MHKKVFWRKLWRIRLQPPRFLPLCKFSNFIQENPRNSKSSWNQCRSLSLSSVAFCVTPTMISTRSLFYFYFKDAIIMSVPVWLPFRPQNLTNLAFSAYLVLPAGKSDHIQCTGKKQYWNSMLMEFFSSASIRFDPLWILGPKLLIPIFHKWKLTPREKENWGPTYSHQ